MYRPRRIRVVQAAFFLGWSAVAVAVHAHLGTLTVEWVTVSVVLVGLFALELGAGTGDRRWWRTRARWPVLLGLVAYLAALGRHLV